MPKLIIMCGRAFAGKTTLAGLIVRRFGYAAVDVDETKVRLFGDAVDDAALARADWIKIYQDTDALIGRYLDSGQSVVDDSRNFTKDERRQAHRIAVAHRAELVTVHVDTPEPITRERLLANRLTPTRHDIPDAAFEKLLNGWEPPTADEHPLPFSFPEGLVEWVERHATMLGDA